jgi:hypothetical protein
MRLSLMGALALALVANLIPGGNRDLSGANAARGSSGESPDTTATGPVKEASTENNNA